jgi:cytochrome c2
MKAFAFLLLILAAACGARDQAPAAPPSATSGDPRVEQGRALIRQYGCQACHVVPGVEGMRGAIGPSLAGIASRPSISSGTVQNTPANLARYVQNPTSLDPQSTMPPIAATDAEAEAIAAFLLTLR